MGLTRIITDYGDLFMKQKHGLYNVGFGHRPGVLEGSGSSGRLIGIISTYPGTSPTPWRRVMAYGRINKKTNKDSMI